MDLYFTIRELTEEKRRLDQVIASLEALERGGEPLVLKKKRGRKSMDANARKEVSERMKRYWADRRQHRGKSEGALAAGSTS